MKPEYEVWAEQLLQDIYYAPDEGHRVAVVKEHLLKAVRRGYVDGANNGWIAAQEASPQPKSVDTVAAGQTTEILKDANQKLLGKKCGHRNFYNFYTKLSAIRPTRTCICMECGVSL
jgi:hypothetical protein